jgi:hypothetical protein
VSGTLDSIDTKARGIKSANVRYMKTRANDVVDDEIGNKVGSVELRKGHHVQALGARSRQGTMVGI